MVANSAQITLKFTIEIYTKTSSATSRLRRSARLPAVATYFTFSTFRFCINSSPQMSSAKLIQLFHGGLKSQLDSFTTVAHVYISEIQKILCTMFVNE